MRRYLSILFVLSCIHLYGQQVPNFQPGFSAKVVKNLTTSSKWYQSVFGLKIKNEISDPNQAYKIHILESANYSVELLELKGSLVKSELLKGNPDGTEVQGHFKIGFKISNTDEWLAHLRKLKIEVPNVWTDQKTGKKNFMIQDPDGNLIQFFD